ncbi:unnamed protein product, partial [Rotaria magnacalcarata]
MLAARMLMFFIKYIDPPVSTQDELHFIYVNIIMNNAVAR